MLERTPFAGMDHAQWRAAMTRAAEFDTAGIRPDKIASHMETAAIITASLNIGKRGAPTTPPWSDLVMLP